MSCTNGPAPAGTSVWQGRVPQELTDWAVGLRNHIASYPFGHTWQRPYNGVTVTARCDCHSWTFRNGELVTGLAIKGITLYRPKAGSTQAFAEAGASDDPLAVPSVDIAGAMFNEANDPAPPSQTPGVDWPMVALTGGGVVAVVTLFVLALRQAGNH